MAKNNNNNNSNYFSQMIAQKGENFLDSLTAKDIQYYHPLGLGKDIHENNKIVKKMKWDVNFIEY